MSSIDNRVVQMEFDNKRFESNVKTTMSTLDKLKQKLSFGKETKELEELQNAGNNFNMSHMANAIDKIGDKFSMLGVLGMTAMSKIANAAVDAGTRILKSLSVDQITAGFDKYTEETNAVQAIYSAVKPKGKTLNQVYGTLEKLAKYTDETSYNYTVMTGTLSNFIGKGLDMQRSETMLEGIANAAASAGVGIQDANILFRNWADAVSSGALALKDWKSMKLVHMDTEAFVNELIDMAKEVGTVDKKTGKLSKTMTSVGKAAADEVVSINNFEELLRYGFVNTEVMARVFEKYADQTTEFGLDAFHAAQQARTFVDVVESLKDAASTGWKTSFRIIFGDLEEATDFFSDMADKLLTVVGDIDEARNNIFKGWRRLGGRETLIEGLNFWWANFEGIRAVISSSFKEAFGIKDMPWFMKPGETYIGDRPEDVLDPGALLKWTQAFRDAGNAVSSWMDEATYWDGEMAGHTDSIEKMFGGLFSVANIGFNMLSGVDTFFASIRKQLAPTFDVVVFYLGKIGGWLSELNQYISVNNVFGKFAERLAKTFEPVTRRLPSTLGWLNKTFVKVKQFLKLNPTMSKAIKQYGNFFNAVIDFLPKGVEGLIQLGKSFYNLVINSTEWKKVSAAYNAHVRPILKRLTEFSGLFAQSMADFLNMDTSKTKGWWNKLKQRFSVFDWLGPWVEEQWGKLKAKYPIFQQIEDWWNTSPIISGIKEFVGVFNTSVDKFFSVDTSKEDSIVGKIKMRFEAMWGELGPWLEKKWAAFKEQYPIFQQIEDFVTNIFGKKEDIEGSEESAEEGNGFVDKIKSIFEKITSIASGISLGDVAKFALGAILVYKAFKTIKSLADWTSLAESLKDAFENVTGAIEQAYKYIKAKKTEARAKTMQAIATSIYLMSMALKNVASLKFEEIALGLVGLGLLMAETGGFMKYLSWLDNKGGNLATQITQSRQLISIAISMWMLGKTLKNVSDIGWDGILQGLSAMGGLFLETGVFMKLIDGLTSASTKIEQNGIFNKIVEKKGKSSSGSILGIAVSMYILGQALKTVSGLGWDGIATGLGGMAGLFAEEGAFMVIMGAFSKKGIDLSSASPLKMIGYALALTMLGNALKNLSGLTWEEIGRGLGVMAGLFVETGAFYILVNRLSGAHTKIEKSGLFKIIGERTGGASGTGLIAAAISIKALGDELMNLASLSWSEIGKGLGAMAGLFAENAAFIGLINFLNKGKTFNEVVVNASVGVLTGAIGSLGKAMAELGQMSVGQLITGAMAIAAISGIVVLFTKALGKIGNDKMPSIKSVLALGILAGGLWIAAQAFSKLAEIKDLGQVGIAMSSMIGIIASLAIMANVMSAVKLKLSSTFTTFATAIALAGLMVAFALAISLVKDVKPATLLSFAFSMDLLALAMFGIANVLRILGGISLAAVVKGTAALTIASAGIGAAIAIILGLTGSAVADFSDKIAIVGANLAAYAEQVTGLDTEAIKVSIMAIKDLSAALVEVGMKDYGNLATFRTEMVRMGANLKMFGLSTAGLDTESTKKVIKDLKEMSEDLSGFAEITEVPEVIGLIGGAIKLYGESVNGIEVGDAPDSTQIKMVLTALLDAIPEDSTVAALGDFASADKSASLTLMATGIVNIGTALSTFSADVKDLALDDVGKAIEVLGKISSLNTGLATVSVANIGPFALEVKTQSGDLTTFATDIVLLGDATAAMAESMGSIDLDRFGRATDIIVKIADMNAKLPPTGGLKQLLIGKQDLTEFAANLRLLGGGAVAFSESIKGESFDAGQVEAAGKALVALAEVNNLLPETGGFKSWFSGDESISNFASQLKTLGKGVVDFNGAIGKTKFGDNVQTALSYLGQIAALQVAPGEGWTISIATLGRDLNDFATELVTFNDTMNDITEPADLKVLEDVLNIAIPKHNELGNVEYVKNLGKLGEDVKKFAANIKGIKASDYADISTVLTSIFDALSKPIDTDFETAGQSMIIAIAKGVTDNGSQLSDVAIVTVCNAAASSANSYSDDFYNVGYNFSAGMASGMSDNSSLVSQAAADVVSKALEAARSEAQQNSPWKTTQEMGKYFDYGLAEGMNNYRDVIEASSREAVNSGLNTVLEQFKMVASLPFDELDLRPTIRPVLDTSDLTAGAQGIGRMFDDQRVRIRGLDTRSMESYASSLGNLDRKDSVPGIMQSINEINGRLDNLGNSIRSMRVVLNSGKVVGGIEDEMDKALGMRMIMAERGN